MTAHYPKLRVPTASVTDTLLEIVISLRRWRGMGGRYERDTKQQATDLRHSQPHSPMPWNPLNKEGNCFRERQVRPRDGAGPQSLAISWTKAASPPSPPQPGARTHPTGDFRGQGHSQDLPSKIILGRIIWQALFID